MLSYKNKTILLTGPTSGIGEAMAYELAKNETTLLLSARTVERLAEVAEACAERGNAAHLFPADLSMPGAAQELYQRIRDAGHHVDILINNAGFGKRGALWETDPDVLEAMIGLNVTNVVSLCRLCIPEMIARRSGGILNLASTSAFHPVPYLNIYGASKAFIRSFSMALHTELKPHNVVVTCLTPGPTTTDFGEAAEMPDGFYDYGTTPDRVARVGLAALRKGRMEAVVGLVNKVHGTAARLTPVPVALALAARILGDRT